MLELVLEIIPIDHIITEAEEQSTQGHEEDNIIIMVPDQKFMFRKEGKYFADMILLHSNN